MKKNRLVIILLLVVLVTVSGCGSKPEAENSATTSTKVEGNTVVAPQTAGVDWQDGALCAIAFVGYESMDKHLYSNSLFMVNEELSLQQEYQDYVIYTGDEVYFVVPRYKDATFKIEEMEHGTGIIGDVLFEGDYVPALIVCNISDLYPNCLITITGNGESVSFSPSISLADGSVVIPSNGKVQDISVPIESVDESLFGHWEANMTIDGVDIFCDVVLDGDGSIVYAFGWPDSEIGAVYEGTYYVVRDGVGGNRIPDNTVVVEMNLIGGALFYHDEEEDDPYKYYEDPTFGLFYGTFIMNRVDGRTLKISNTSGDVFIYGDEPYGGFEFILQDDYGQG